MSVESQGVAHAEAAERLAVGGCLVLLGGLDTGKTSFALGVAELARSRGLRVAYVDADIDQSTVGPPACVGLKLCDGLDRVDAAGVAQADALAFVGSVTPQGHSFSIAAATARMVALARDAGAELIVVDTSSYISGVYAEVLKYRKLELVRADAVVGFQRGGELEPILSTVARFFSIPVLTLGVDPAVSDRSVEERLSYRQARLRSYFPAPLQRWRMRTTVFMPTLPPDLDPARLDGLMVGLEDGNDSCMGIGVLEFDREEGVLRMVSSVPEPAKGLLLGSVRITTEGAVIGRVTLRELFGPESAGVHG
ncbi:MAG: Clp1/GlmU family protein [Actinomycetota bacterium]